MVWSGFGDGDGFFFDSGMEGYCSGRPGRTEAAHGGFPFGHSSTGRSSDSSNIGLGQGFGNFDVQGAEPLGSADEVAGAGAELFHRLVVVALHGVDILADCFERSDESDEFVVHHGPLAGDAVGVASEVVAFPEVVHNLEHTEEVRG